MALEKITKIGSNGLDEDVSAGGGGLGTTDFIEKLLFIHLSLIHISEPTRPY